MPTKKPRKVSDVAKRFREIRKKENLTQAEFARRLNWTQARVSYYENGWREPDEEAINAIAREFGYDRTWMKWGAPSFSTKEERLREIQLIEKYIQSMNLDKLRFTRKWIQLTVGQPDEEDPPENSKPGKYLPD